MLKVSLISDIDEYDSVLHEFTRRQIKDHPINMYECHDGVYLMCLDLIDVTVPDMDPSQLVICLSEDSLLFFCENAVVRDRVNDLISEIGTEGKDEPLVLYDFLAELTKNDVDSIEKIEDELNELEENIVERHNTSDPGNIRKIRGEIRGLRRYYDELDIIGDALVENELGIIPDSMMRRFGIFHDRVERMSSLVRELREYSTQVREAYQSQIDIEQNNIMKVFTIISGIFLPLTLLVGWYGMNFHMPEFTWKYGYAGVIAASIAIVIICVVFFRKKKWM